MYISCLRKIKDVKTPLFLFSCEDDPIIGTDSYPQKEIEQNEYLMLGTTKSGGHIGYLTSALGCE